MDCNDTVPPTLEDRHWLPFGKQTSDSRSRLDAGRSAALPWAGVVAVEGREGLGLWLCSGADAGGFAAGSGEEWRRRRSLHDVKAFGQEHWKKR